MPLRLGNTGDEGQSLSQYTFDWQLQQTGCFSFIGERSFWLVGQGTESIIAEKPWLQDQSGERLLVQSLVDLEAKEGNCLSSCVS